MYQADVNKKIINIASAHLSRMWFVWCLLASWVGWFSVFHMQTSVYQWWGCWNIQIFDKYCRFRIGLLMRTIIL